MPVLHNQIFFDNNFIVIAIDYKIIVTKVMMKILLQTVFTPAAALPR